MPDLSIREPGRRTPARGVHIKLRGPNWVFLTVCTKDRERWLNDLKVQTALHKVWKEEALAWLVSDYLLMPDHIHLFCAPYDTNFTIERWIGYWKDRLSKHGVVRGKFQIGGLHHRLRNGESYSQKWQYVRENPVRASLVERPEHWPYAGRVHDIRFS